MEGIKQGQQQEPRQEALPIPEEYFDAYREGNLRFPQQSMGIVVFVAEAALRDPNFNVRDFMRTQWTDEQFQNILKTMNHAHQAKHIPVGTPDGLAKNIEKIIEVHGPDIGASFTPEVVSHERVRKLWTMTKKAVLGAIGTVSGIHGNEAYFAPHVPAPEEFLDELTEHLAEPEVKNQARETFAALHRILLQPEIAEKAAQLRNIFDSRKIFPDAAEHERRKNERNRLTVEIFNDMVQRFREEGGELDGAAEEIFMKHYV